MSVPDGPNAAKPSPLGMWNRRRLLWALGIAMVAWLVFFLVLLTARPKVPERDRAEPGRRTTTSGTSVADVVPACKATRPETYRAVVATLPPGSQLLEVAQEELPDQKLAFISANVYDEDDKRIAEQGLWLAKDGKVYTLNPAARKVSEAPNGIPELTGPLADYGAAKAALACTARTEHVPR